MTASADDYYSDHDVPITSALGLRVSDTILVVTA